jgi:hypothetical protein
MHYPYTPPPIPVQSSTKDLEAESAELDVEYGKIADEIDELEGWAADLYRELEIILDRRDKVRKQLARLRAEEAQA